MLPEDRLVEREELQEVQFGDSNEPERQNGKKSAGEGGRAHIMLQFMSQGKCILHSIGQGKLLMPSKQNCGLLSYRVDNQDSR